MDPNPSAPAPESHPPVPDGAGELIVQNGRQKGTRRPLGVPLTVIGRAEGCDLRLNVEGVSPWHCLLATGAGGELVLRGLQSGSDTLVNGKPAASATLRDGDVLTVGPFGFLVRVPGPAGPSPDPDAVRVQAAAVSAQQAALVEEEIRTVQRRTSLKQQEEQLAAILEEKQRRLLEVREQVKKAHAELRKDRAAHEADVREQAATLARQRQEITDGAELLQANRQRLKGLHRRIKQRFHLRWSAERAAMDRRERELAEERRRVEERETALRDERAVIDRARRRFNGQAELGRRQLQAAWDLLNQDRRQWEDRRAREEARLAEDRHRLEQRAAALQEAERRVNRERQALEETRHNLEREIQGLDTRARNQHLKLLEQANASPAAGAAGREETAPVRPPNPPALTVLPAVPVAQLFQGLCDDLADQRRSLVEQCQRLVHTQQIWEGNREAVAAELEVVGRQMYERENALVLREEALAAREQALAPVEDDLGRQEEQLANRRRILDAWQAHRACREAAWEGERERLRAHLQSREEAAEKRLQKLDEMLQRWQEERRREVEGLVEERAAGETLRRECAALRKEWLRRQVALEQKQRDLAEQALALEQFRQQYLTAAGDAPAAEKRLQRLQRRWGDLAAHGEKTLRKERKFLQREADRVKHGFAQLQKRTERLAREQFDLAAQQKNFERQQRTAQDETAQLRQQLYCLHAQRESYEQQLQMLRDELERLAHLLLDEAEPLALPPAKAA